jgi:hypothetical protein
MLEVMVKSKRFQNKLTSRPPQQELESATKLFILNLSLMYLNTFLIQ